MPEIIFSYSWWAILLVFLAGLVYAGLLYAINTRNKLNAVLTVILFIFRFVTVAILVFLLLSPTIKTRKKQIEKPIIIIGQDNSMSILMAQDSAYYADSLGIIINNLIDEFSLKIDIDNYIFGNSVKSSISPDYTDNLSNYSDFFNYVKQNYTGLNVGALILIGDGIVNNGIDPVYSASDIPFPIFTVALGDTLQVADIKIDDVRHNSIVYTGDIFPVEVNLSANMLKGKKATIKLLGNNDVIDQKEVSISSDNYRELVKFNVVAEKAGKQRYRVKIDILDAHETNFENNVRNIFVDVVSSRKKILILAFAPHPDIGAIKQSLLKNQNYKVEIEYISSFDKDVKQFDLVILHQLPSKNNLANRLLVSLSENKVPVLFVIGKQSSLSATSKYYKGLNIISATGSTVSAQFEFNSSFTLFSFNDDLAAQLSTLPPLTVPLGNFSLSHGAEVFGWQRINNITTDFPLITFYSSAGVRSGAILGEGIWLWRIQNYLQYNNSIAVETFLSKAVMYLIANSDSRHFRLQTKGEYDSRSDVILVAELYNKSLEPDNSADVRIVLSNENNEKFNFIFSPFEDYYKLNLNKLPVGVYSYKANVKLGNNNYKDVGEFIVQSINYESRNLLANHRVLNRLASEHNGNMYYPDQISKLRLGINNLRSMTSKIHYEDKFTGLNTELYILVALILLLSVEWFLRKYFGSY